MNRLTHNAVRYNAASDSFVAVSTTIIMCAEHFIRLHKQNTDCAKRITSHRIWTTSKMERFQELVNRSVAQVLCWLSVYRVDCIDWHHMHRIHWLQPRFLLLCSLSVHKKRQIEHVDCWRQSNFASVYLMGKTMHIIVVGVSMVCRRGTKSVDASFSHKVTFVARRDTGWDMETRWRPDRVLYWYLY